MERNQIPTLSKLKLPVQQLCSPMIMYKYYIQSLWVKNNIKYSHKHLKKECDSTIFLKPTSQEEICNIISSLNSNKASGPNSIPYRILILLKNEISMQLEDLFNLSFVTGIFP